jgi:hypothetical protein
VIGTALERGSEPSLGSFVAAVRDGQA